MLAVSCSSTCIDRAREGETVRFSCLSKKGLGIIASILMEEPDVEDGTMGRARGTVFVTTASF